MPVDISECCLIALPLPYFAHHHRLCSTFSGTAACAEGLQRMQAWLKTLPVRCLCTGDAFPRRSSLRASMLWMRRQ